MKICIGIDGGEHTGFAVWHSGKKAFIELSTVTFWDAIEQIKKYQFSCGQTINLEVHIEDVESNKAVFGPENTYNSTKADHSGKVRAVAKQGINVGKVMDKSNLMIDFCERAGIKVVKRKPTSGSMTKLDKTAFERITKVKTRTSQHVRDAALLVYGI
jgi:hypothetical protein